MKFTHIIALILLVLSAACTNSTGPEYVSSQDSLDPGIIAFVSDRETNARRQLFLMNSDGSDPVRITHDSNDYRCPVFSPDGSKILFYSHTTDNSDEIFVVDVDGSNLVNLSNASGNDNCPCYSPDGSRIVFTSSRDGNREIYIMDSNGQNQTRLTFDERVDGGPQFTDGGTRVLYYSFEEHHRGYSISIMDIDGGNKKCLTEGEFYFQNQAFVSDGSFKPSDVMPGISPDGSKIAFMSFDTEACIYLIFMMDFDGRHHRLLVDAPCYNVAPVFTPEGDKIIFRSNRIQAYDLYEMDPEDEMQTNLTDRPGHAYFCQFVQNDSKILFHMDTGFYHKIWLMNRDGSDQIQLTQGDGNDYDPQFLPLAEGRLR
jgi:Tol biopolymer transport system component